MKQILIFLAVLSINLTMAQVKTFIDQPYLETTAKVDSLVNPDIIHLNILLRETDERNRVSVEELENKMANKLESLGVDLQKQLTVSDMTSNFKKYFLRGKEVVKEKAFDLKLFSAQSAGKVMQGLEDIGISNVNISKLEYSKMEELQLQLKSKAVAKAKLQAEYLLEPLGQNLLKAIHITDRFFHHYAYAMDEMNVRFAKAEMAQAEPLDVEFKPMKVESEVSIKFAID